MREIKFRAWDGIEMTVYPYRGYTDGALCFTDDSGYVDGYFDDDPQPESVMQYTGRKDKNGREIYQGDIVTNKQKEIGIVKWLDNIAGFSIDYSPSGALGKSYYGISANAFIEVIGNIYENPELLK